MRLLGFILFFAALLLLGSIGVKAQTVIPTGAVNQTTIQRGGYGADTLFVIPIRDTFCNNFLTLRCRGRITQQPSTNNIYYHDGAKWRGIGGGADSSIFVTLTYLNNVLDGYIQWGDTLDIIATKSDIPQQFDSTYLSQRIDSIVGVLDEFLRLDDPRIPNWETAYNNSIVSAAFTGTSVKTQTLTQQDGGTVTSSFFDRVGTPGFGLRDTFAVDTSLIQTRYRADSMNATKWTIGGDNTTASRIFGTLSNQPIDIRTNNVTRAVVSGVGRWSFNAGVAQGTTTFVDNNSTVNSIIMPVVNNKAGLWITTSQSLSSSPGNNTQVAGALNVGLSVTTGAVNSIVGTFGGANPAGSIVGGSGFTFYSADGFGGYYRQNSATTGSERYGYYAHNYVQGAFTGNIMNGFRSGGQMATPGSTTASVSDFQAVNFSAMTNGTITTRTGLSIEFDNTNITNARGIWQTSSTLLNHFNGNVLLGKTTPGYGILDVNGNASISGTTLFGTTVDPLTERVYISGTLGITQTPAGNLATDSLLVKINGSQRVGRIAPITTLITEQQAGFTSSTTNATPATIHTIPLTTSGQVLVVDIDLAWKSGASIGRGRKTVTYINNSGTLTILGSVVDIVTTMTQPAVSGSSFTITTSGTNVIVQATGLAATNISWSGVAKYKYHF